MGFTAWVYVRCSTDEQDQSIEDQQTEEGASGMLALFTAFRSM